MKHIARSTIIIAVFFGLEKVLGFLRSIAIARQFGLSAELDAFNAANNIPDLLFALISGGALAIAFIPVLSEYIETSGRPAAWDLFSRIANLFFLATAALSVVIALLSRQLVNWGLGIAPGFSAAQQDLVVHLMRLDLIATLLFSLSGLAMAGLQANQHFILPAIAPMLFDIGGFVGVLVLAPQTSYQFGPVRLPAFGLGISGLVYGVILGAVLFLALQVPGLLYYQFRWTPAINLRHPGVRKVLALMGPRILTMFFIQLVFLAQDNLASRLIQGSVTALVYGWLFMQVPETLIGTAIGTALLPTLSEQITRGEGDAFRQALNHSMRVILALTLPSTVLLAVVIRPVVAILGFDPAGSDLVVWTTRAYLVGLIGHSLLEVGARAFYAQQDARTPLFASAMTIVLFIILGSILSPILGAPGIGLANSLAFSGEAILLWWLLIRRYRGLVQLRNLLPRVVLVSICAGLLVFGLMRLPLPRLPLAIGALAVAGLFSLPFLWGEVKLLVKL